MHWFALVLLLACANVALAQEPAPKESTQPEVVERQAKARAGRTLRLLTITNLRPDCTSGPMPTVRLETAPKHGKVVMQRVRQTTLNQRQCLASEVPALVAIYQSTPDFEGSDTVTLEIRFEGKPAQLRRYTITVTKIDDGTKI